MSVGLPPSGIFRSLLREGRPTPGAPLLLINVYELELGCFALLCRIHHQRMHYILIHWLLYCLSPFNLNFNSRTTRACFFHQIHRCSTKSQIQMCVNWQQFLYWLLPVHSHSPNPGSSSHYNLARQLPDLLTSLPPLKLSLLKTHSCRATQPNMSSLGHTNPFTCSRPSRYYLPNPRVQPTASRHRSYNQQIWVQAQLWHLDK